MLSSYEESDGAFFDKRVAGRLGSYLKPYWHKMGLALITMLISTGVGLGVPYMIKMAIDGYITAGDPNGLMRISLLMIAAYVADALASGQQTYILSVVGQTILNKMRVQLFEHYEQLSLAFHAKEEVGTLISRVLSDVGVLNELITSGFISMIGDVLLLVGTVGIMLSINWRLALLTFSVMPLMMLATWLFSRAAKAVYRRTRVTIGALTGDMAENLANMRVVQAFAQEGTASQNFDKLNRENRDVNIKAIVLSYIYMPTAELLNTLATGIVLWIGGMWVSGGSVTIGIVVSFLTYVTRFFQPIRDLTQIYTTFQAAMAGGERIFDLFDQPYDIVDAPDAIEVPDITGHIELNDVSFSYDGTVPVLQGVNLDIQPGSTIAFVGATGAGKTTIASLICRFYDVTGGEILIDGHDLRHIKIKSYHSQLGIVPQEPFLFQTTIADNIRFSRPDATDEEVREAARLANADEFITRLPEGYATPVQEGSSNLSLGQRQLLCFARAILAKPHILILDEATSSVDTRTELLIQDALRKLLKGRTSIVIAHRLSTIREADLICVVDGGKLVERGTHEQLMSAGGRYAQLYAQQFAPVAV